MAEAVMNKKIRVTVPEGFTQLTPYQVKQLTGTAGLDHMVFYDNARQIMIELMWQSLPLLAFAAPLEKIIRNTAATYIKSIPSMRDWTMLDRETAGMEAKGFSYDYTVNGVDQTSCYIGIKYKGKIYAFTCVARKEDEALCTRLFNELLDSVAV